MQEVNGWIDACGRCSTSHKYLSLKSILVWAQTPLWPHVSQLVCSKLPFVCAYTCILFYKREIHSVSWAPKQDFIFLFWCNYMHQFFSPPRYPEWLSLLVQNGYISNTPCCQQTLTFAILFLLLDAQFSIFDFNYFLHLVLRVRLIISHFAGFA